MAIPMNRASVTRLASGVNSMVIPKIAISTPDMSISHFVELNNLFIVISSLSNLVLMIWTALSAAIFSANNGNHVQELCYRGYERRYISHGRRTEDFFYPSLFRFRHAHIR